MGVEEASVEGYLVEMGVLLTHTFKPLLTIKRCYYALALSSLQTRLEDHNAQAVRKMVTKGGGQRT